MNAPKKMKSIIINRSCLVLCCVFYFGFILTQTNCLGSDTINANHVKAERFQQRTTEGSSEERYYKLLYQHQIDANDDILKTIFYALGGLGSAMLLVFASNWWFNEKKVKDITKDIERDIRLAREAALTEVSNRLSESQQELQSSFNELKQKTIEEFREQLASGSREMIRTNEQLRLEAREDARRIFGDFDNKFRAFSDSINIQNATISKSTEERFEAIHKLLSSTEERLVSLTTSALIRSEKATKSLEIDLNEIKVKDYKASKVYRNALYYRLVQMKLAIEIGAHWRLIHLVSDLAQLITKSDSVYTSDVQLFDDIMKDLPEQFSSKVHEWKILMDARPLIK
jgi:hypothetical protein